MFIDRHMKSGDEWENVMTYEIRNTDAVVILLSLISVYGEMPAYEADSDFTGMRCFCEKRFGKLCGRKEEYHTHPPKTEKFFLFFRFL
ncbi:Uncharacterized protein dnm_072670 [Desulfonema magnum]|uniref:Uncharacterized protein n=1 Tax=Desulfonema magnum TaxID=45655 RepID=A0A975BTG6_9BACT|nr:Uncharacterized protein dnm_072670 [Desulfonema magnum]